MSWSNPKLKYRSDIDGLRAVAVLAVLIFHFDLVSGGKAGFMGFLKLRVPDHLHTEEAA